MTKRIADPAGQDRRAQLEAAAAQGRADVAAGFDPFAGLPIAEHTAERATGHPTLCAHCGASVCYDHAGRSLEHTAT